MPNRRPVPAPAPDESRSLEAKLSRYYRQFQDGYQDRCRRIGRHLGRR